MEPENTDDGHALRRFITLLIGGAGDLDRCAHAPADEPHSIPAQLSVQARIRHTADCPAENDDVVICTCGALYRLAVTSGDDAAAALTLAKIV